MKVESTLFFNADIKSWAYMRGKCPCEGSDDSKIRILLLDSELEHEALGSRRWLRFNVVCASEASAAKRQFLELHDAMDEAGIPDSATLVITLSEAEFNDLKECLALAMGHDHALVRISFGVQGFQQEQSGKIEGAWYASNAAERIDGRPLEVIGLCWELHCHEKKTA